MSVHYTYLSHFVESEDTQRFITAIFLGGIFILIASKLGSLIKGDKKNSHIIPDQKISFFGLVDWLLERFFKYHDSVIGKGGREHAPFIATVFFFILSANLIGVFPGMPAITNSIWINVGISLAVFIYFNLWGIRKHGLLNYIKHFAGPINGWFSIVVVAPLVFCAEILSTVLRPFTLNLRLYWNIKGDHMVLGILHDLLGVWSIPLASPLFILAVFVSFIQAFVFATLTMIYVMLAVDHGEEHH